MVAWFVFVSSFNSNPLSEESSSVGASTITNIIPNTAISDTSNGPHNDIGDCSGRFVNFATALRDVFERRRSVCGQCRSCLGSYKVRYTAYILCRQICPLGSDLMFTGLSDYLFDLEVYCRYMTL